MIKKTELISKLTDAQKKELQEHFNSIYECPKLAEHEHNIIYLAWLWANGQIIGDESGSMLDDYVTDVKMDDYEITFEDDEGGGINLDFFYDFYQLDKIMELMNWKN